MFRCDKSSRRGFTLLETMLSVAILLIVTLMAYEGFMSTLNYAGDTALAERIGNENAGYCYEQMGSKTNVTGSLGKNGALAKTTAIMITGTNFKSVLQVNPIVKNGGVSAFSGINGVDSDYADSTGFVNTTNRHGFTYCQRTCPNHPGNVLQYYKVTVSGSEVIVGRCSDSSCVYSSTGSRKNDLVVKWST